ncbi:MAG: coproporphyrinogen dehydrogenase HemZ [Lachnospiraceae bacterium]|nr:coproporphyrinogen dehydrogenase HemZ [Lachnospiraceae bacterium]
MQVILNSPGFSYDVHSLVKAFYPEEDIVITDEGTDAPISIRIDPADPAGDDIRGSVSITAPQSRDVSAHFEEFSHLSRPEVKNLVKRLLYAVLFDITHRTLPWGTMTGIRPVKVPMKMIREGCDDAAIKDYMQSVYLTGDEKTDLAIEIAHTEKKILDLTEPGGYSLYIGIPFCPTTCMYCSFTSYPITSWKERVDDYLLAVKRELDFFAGYYDRGPDSVYIGGGTPTTLSPEQLSDLLGYVEDNFDMSLCRERTVEAGRPDSITREKLCVIKEHGFDRISINPQTMNDKTLRLIGRRHTTDDVYAAFETARSVGFSNINTDIIIGLPGEGEKEVEGTLSAISSLSPDSLTIHSMAIKRAAAMNDFLSGHEELRVKDTKKLMDMAVEAARGLGLMPYYLYRQKNMSGNLENIGFARKDRFGIYNVLIMEEVSDIAAAGAGTISKRVFSQDRYERCDNVKDVAMYIDRIDEMIDRKKKLFNKGE